MTLNRRRLNVVTTSRR